MIYYRLQKKRKGIRLWPGLFSFCGSGYGGNMKEFAEVFYNSKAWKQCRSGYRKSVGGLCEDCLKKGLITPGEIVHHKIAITPENITDPSVTLNWQNLKLVCRNCHAIEHGARICRYTVDPIGRVTVRE